MKRFIISTIAISVLSSTMVFAASNESTSVLPIATSVETAAENMPESPVLNNEAKTEATEDEETTAEEATAEEATSEEPTEDEATSEDEATAEEATAGDEATSEKTVPLTKLTPAIKVISAKLSDASNFISEVSVSNTTENIEIQGVKPVLQKTDNADLEKTVNAEIDAYYLKQVEKNKADGTLLLSFNYKSYINGDVASIVVYTTSTIASSMNNAESFNFNLKTGAMVDLNKQIGPNGTKLVNKKISNISKSDETYKIDESFSGIMQDQSFYVENDVVYIILNDKQAVKEGETFAIIEVPLADVIDVFVNDSNYMIVDNVKYLKLRETATALGYDVNWDEETKTIDVSGYDNKNDNKFKIGSNEISTTTNENKAITKEIESPVISKKGVSYLPLSYFEVILGCAYEVNSDGNVTISKLK